MVLDLQNRVLDINPAFEEIVGVTSSTVSARPAEEVCGKIPELASVCADKNITHSEFFISANGLSKVYEVLFSPLVNDRGILIDRLAVTYDMTKKKQEQRRI